ncbi:MAG: pyridoxamine 5'-phosphate oxidase family protein [Lentilactobacillus hilgardii]|jgi:predicted pyridoxine 5'-phosphate oxidase superfamily flavin-nucleotide-binding protein|uniref:pyridoxamine 5'-phosphate oxidase family protein n=1 Tax=Lentilactobacillus hilgardii TaxID=1588 RepID=UPI00019C672C|nr:pyridoxamine 5'-phosphate oxidase family protein [Lentilactobacillus hilgardii]EEI19478.1 pyridoxamine 5'-phosphate oxidase family protein [Lentilactobacillus buchneri ATCC 11577]MCI2020383.1 pyridoxamine 5'-phosphate oxidase family protein [Lentilactobacillus buchneri]MBZ2200299.1 pyridoxamine 5'-phosphate oxidase family protein [Lentilactobacillus hilgardii]MBZ2203424.1 pyridoxamine 5'-phosphate oxidase family protein [Lentilactobacillus hilgardii]MCI2028635.1 pyridoxamine 5'-phosphate ox
MADLSEEMKNMINEQLPFLATADENGVPKVGPKGSLQVMDDSHLLYYEHTFRHAYHNLKQNAYAAVAVADRSAQKGFRFEGKSHIHEGDSLAKKILPPKIFDRFPRAAVVVIDVEHIYKLDNNLDAGTRLA